jgi:hypothetical protein
MPKANQSKISSIVEYFRKAPLDVMDIAFDLVRDEVNGRRAKARAAGPETASPSAAVHTKKAKGARKKVAGPKKSHHKKKLPAAPADVALPLDALSDAYAAADAADVAEASDAPPQTLTAPA